jgi:hypothetical protein
LTLVFIKPLVLLRANSKPTILRALKTEGFVKPLTLGSIESWTLLWSKAF